VTEGVILGDGVLVGVRVGVAEGNKFSVLVGDGVGVCVGVPVGVFVGVREVVGVGEGKIGSTFAPPPPALALKINFAILI
jgi:hypothetical protein